FGSCGDTGSPFASRAHVPVVKCRLSAITSRASFSNSTAVMCPPFPGGGEPQPSAAAVVTSVTRSLRRRGVRGDGVGEGLLLRVDRVEDGLHLRRVVRR